MIPRILATILQVWLLANVAIVTLAVIKGYGYGGETTEESEAVKEADRIVRTR